MHPALTSAPRQVRLELEFDGAAYFGWQFQPNRPTVQGRVEAALHDLYAGKVGIVGAGRTDTGVSALEYTASFRPSRDLAPRAIRAALNQILPSDIRVRRARLVPASFHARYGAKSRLYRYTIVRGRSPLLGHRAWEVDYDLDPEKMTRAAKLFLGRHDFVPFCRLSERSAPPPIQPPAAKDSPQSTLPSGAVWVKLAKVVRRRCAITDLPLIQFEFEADRFLYKMVRRMAGALFDIGRGRYSRDDLAQAISDHPQVQFTTAPAQGLLFVRARYR